MKMCEQSEPGAAYPMGTPESIAGSSIHWVVAGALAYNSPQEDALRGRTTETVIGLGPNRKMPVYSDKSIERIPDMKKNNGPIVIKQKELIDPEKVQREDGLNYKAELNPDGKKKLI